MFNEDRLKSFYFFLWFLSLWSLFRVYAKALSCNRFPIMEAAILRSSLDFWSKGFKASPDIASWSKYLHVVALNYVSSHLCFLVVVLGSFELLPVNNLQHLWNTSVHNGAIKWKSFIVWSVPAIFSCSFASLHNDHPFGGKVLSVILSVLPWLVPWLGAWSSFLTLFHMQH